MRVRPLMDCLMSEIGTFSFFDLGVNIDSIDHWLECASGYSFYIRVRICIICFFLYSQV